MPPRSASTVAAERVKPQSIGSQTRRQPKSILRFLLLLCDDAHSTARAATHSRKPSGCIPGWTALSRGAVNDGHSLGPGTAGWPTRGYSVERVTRSSVLPPLPSRVVSLKRPGSPSTVSASGNPPPVMGLSKGSSGSIVTGGLSTGAETVVGSVMGSAAGAPV